VTVEKFVGHSTSYQPSFINIGVGKVIAD